MQNMVNRNMGLIDKCEGILMSTNQVENVQRQTEYLPIGKHGGKLGESSLQFFRDGINIYLQRYAKFMGIESEDIQSIVDAYCKEANEYHTMAPIVRVFAQKMSYH